MRLLLFITLYTVTGCGISFKVKGCPGGSVWFKCNLHPGNEPCRQKTSFYPCYSLFKSTTGNNKGNHNGSSHDTKEKNFQVNMTHHQKGISGCSVPMDNRDNKTCHQIAMVKTDTTITCHYPEEFKNVSKYICKGDYIQNCKKTKQGRLSLSSENDVMNLSISKVGTEHTGLYWCGVQATDSVLVMKSIRLQTVKTFDKSADLGHHFSFWCNGNDPKAKELMFICKGEDAFNCQRVLNGSKDHNETHDSMTNGRFSMVRLKIKNNITVHINDMRIEDSGTYWIGEENSEGTVFRCRFHVTVHSQTMAVWQTVAIVALDATLLLLLVVTVIYICRRVVASKMNAAARRKRESLHVYEEIPQRPLTANTGTVATLATFHITAPTSQCSVLRCSTLAIQSNSDELGHGTSADGCTVNQSPTWSDASSTTRWDDPLNSIPSTTSNYVVNITVSVKHTPE